MTKNSALFNHTLDRVVKNRLPADIAGLVSYFSTSRIILIIVV
ncbi:MAG: hypothetical protein ABI419_08785 [Ginsengibacter sp.]